MQIASITRRGFLKVACVTTGAALIGIRMTGKAVAAVKQIKDYMLDRINSVYGADAKFPVRASQDNTQVKALYKSYLEKPLGHKSHDLLHTHWFDKSKGVKELTTTGKLPNPRASEFEGPYPYE